MSPMAAKPQKSLLKFSVPNWSCSQRTVTWLQAYLGSWLIFWACITLLRSQEMHAFGDRPWHGPTGCVFLSCQLCPPHTHSLPDGQRCGSRQIARCESALIAVCVWPFVCDHVCECACAQVTEMGGTEPVLFPTRNTMGLIN